MSRDLTLAPKVQCTTIVVDETGSDKTTSFVDAVVHLPALCFSHAPPQHLDQCHATPTMQVHHVSYSQPLHAHNMDPTKIQLPSATNTHRQALDLSATDTHRQALDLIARAANGFTTSLATASGTALWNYPKCRTEYPKLPSQEISLWEYPKLMLMMCVAF